MSPHKQLQATSATGSSTMAAGVSPGRGLRLHGQIPGLALHSQTASRASRAPAGLRLRSQDICRPQDQACLHEWPRCWALCRPAHQHPWPLAAGIWQTSSALAARPTCAACCRRGSPCARCSPAAGPAAQAAVAMPPRPATRGSRPGGCCTGCTDRTSAGSSLAGSDGSQDVVDAVQAVCKPDACCRGLRPRVCAGSCTTWALARRPRCPCAAAWGRLCDWRTRYPPRAGLSLQGHALQEQRPWGRLLPKSAPGHPSAPQGSSTAQVTALIPTKCCQCQGL